VGRISYWSELAVGQIDCKSYLPIWLLLVASVTVVIIVKVCALRSFQSSIKTSELITVSNRAWQSSRLGLKRYQKDTRYPIPILILGMLNYYWIFDYRIKCLFSISSVAHSLRIGRRDRRWTVNIRPHTGVRCACDALAPRCHLGKCTSSLWAAGSVGESRLWRLSFIRCAENLIFSPRPSADSDLRSVIVCNQGSVVHPHLVFTLRRC